MEPIEHLPKKSKRIGLLLMLMTHFVVFVLVFFDVPILRQAIGFLYLTFIPGYALLRVLKLQNFGLLESILFSVGLSIALLMFTGLSMSQVLPVMGIREPLRTELLLLVIFGIVSTLYVLDCFLQKDSNLSINAPDFSLSILLLAPIPLLSILGVLLSRNSANALLTMMILAIAALIALAVISDKIIPPRYYPSILFAIAIALVWHQLTVSNYVVGSGDANVEFYVFRLTRDKSQWIPNLTFDYETGGANAMLSVTVLPTIYANILNMTGEWVFKSLFPFIFSMVPIVLYGLYKEIFDKKIALLSMFLLVSQWEFYWEVAKISKQMTAELFLALLLLLLLRNKKDLGSRICFMVFSAALVTSHYGSSYIFLFCLVSAWILSKLDRNANLDFTPVALYCTLLFSWYIFLSYSTAFSFFVYDLKWIYDGVVTDFFNPATRGEMVLRGVGMGTPTTFYHQIGRILRYTTELLIILGFFAVVVNQKRLRVSTRYVLLSTSSLGILFCSLALPYFASAFNITRIYHYSLLILSPLCILGGGTLLKSVTKVERYKLTFMSLLLASTFLFDVQLVYEIAQDNIVSSIPLSGYRMNKIEIYLNLLKEQEVFGANWLLNHRYSNIFLYSDRISRYMVLTSYSLQPRENGGDLYGWNLAGVNGVQKGIYIYLSETNYYERLKENEDVVPRELLDDSLSRIYSNGEVKIYT